jgi:hypothetical protein
VYSLEFLAAADKVERRRSITPVIAAVDVGQWKWSIVRQS